jgi:hypothetical protein
MRAIAATDAARQLWLLAALYGLPSTLHAAQLLEAGARFALPQILGAALVLAPFAGMLGIIIASALLYWTGRWIGGQGSLAAIKAAVAWSNLPNVCSIAVWGYIVWIMGSAAFTSALPEYYLRGVFPPGLAVMFAVQGGAAIWSFILLLQALGEVQGFSAWKALLNVLIPFMIVTAVLWMVMGFAMWLTGGMQR